jgi:hypothetical protein
MAELLDVITVESMTASTTGTGRDGSPTHYQQQQVRIFRLDTRYDF